MENTVLIQYQCPSILLLKLKKIKKKTSWKIPCTWDFDLLIKDTETNRPKGRNDLQNVQKCL